LLDACVMSERLSASQGLISTFALLAAASLSLIGCASDAPPPEGGAGRGTAGSAGSTDPGEGSGDTEFVSDSQTANAGGPEVGTGGSGSNASGSAGSTAAPSAGDDAGGDPDRAISEADIIKVEGDTLYALSRFSGLTIIDLSNPADLRVLGRYQSSATPFEMYVESGTAYVMYNDFSHREYDEEVGYYVWQSSSRMTAIDVSDPRSPALLGYQNLPGEISDSRKVGDVVYVVTHQSNYCWQCDTVSNTRVSSYDVSDPSVFAPVDSERFEDSNESWGVRHVSASQDRLYVSGYSWSSTGQPQAGTIQVVDISDPDGDIVPGAVVEISGQIDNRWQMDEYAGVLRVISQPASWNALTAPVVETFAIDSSSAVSPLARLPMVLPRQEALQSVRFDGARAFAVTFERTDPLFTFDLSDPARPLQVGELEIPGFLYFMEPRGDRLYSLGFDNSVDDGALHVSIFDVSNLAAPALLDRVNFGGDWAWLAEDQDRVHKLFNLALDQELILLPFSGSLYDEETCYYDWESGIQLIDARGDALTLRGVAPQIGEARRSLLHDDYLFGVSDNAIQAFDISDRDAPRRIDRLDVARNVNAVRAVGGDLLRFGQNWWTGETELDLVPMAQAEVTVGEKPLDLTPLTGVSEQICNRTDGSYSSSSSSFTGQVFVNGSYAFLPRQHNEYSYSGNGADYRNSQTMRISIVALAGDDAPRVVGEIALEPTTHDQPEFTYSSYAGFVQTDGALLVGRHSGSYGNTTNTTKLAYDVIDLSAGADARVVSRFEVPDNLAWGGWGYPVMGCMVDVPWGWYGYSTSSTLSSGNMVASQHQVPLDDGTGRVRYYLDRIDVTDPAAPVVLDPINIPGQVVHYEHERGLLVTLEDVRQSLGRMANYRACLEAYPGASWELDQQAYGASGYNYENTPGNCTLWHRRLNSLRLEARSPAA
jgi:hypothetical protein